MPKRSTAVVCALLLLIALAHAPVRAEAREDYDPHFTMLALNMAVVSVFNIVSTQDRIVLDQEYDNIINNLKLGNIEDDKEIKDLYDELMNVISKSRLRVEERQRFKEKFDWKKRQAIVRALSGIQAQGDDAWSFLGSLLVSSATAYFSYREEMNAPEEKFTDDVWKLKKDQIQDFDELQRKLLSSSWSLLRKYSLPDEYRITQRDLEDFNRAVNEQDKYRSVRMFRALEPDFKAYPIFWFFYGKAAKKENNNDLAERCFQEFDRIWRPVLRLDPYRLETAKYKIESLLKSHASRDDIFEQLRIIRENAPRENWNAKLFLGVLYFALGDKKLGIEFVEENIFFDIEKDLSMLILRSMDQDRLDTFQLGNELQAALQEHLAKETERQEEEERKAAEFSTDPEQKEIEKGLIAYFENRDEEAEKIFGPLIQTLNNPVPATVLGTLKTDARSKVKNVPECLPLFRKSMELKEKNESAFKSAFLKIFPFVEKFAKEGNARAQSLLGTFYQTGRGVSQDNRLAVEFFRKAAEQGDSWAQRNLGMMYEQGQAVPQDDRQAVEWFRKAAEQGEPVAQRLLGWMFAEGRGASRNDRWAFEWYRKAAEQGEPVAQRALANMYMEGRGVPQDDRKAAEWYRKAAENQDITAQKSLGWMYAKGRGVPQNYINAYFWFYLALLYGDEYSQSGLDEIKGKGLFNLRKLSENEIELVRHKATQFYDEQRRKYWK